MQQVAAAQRIPARVQEVAKAQRLGVLHRIYETKKEPLLFRVLGPVAIVTGLLILASYFLAYAILFSWLPQWQTILIPLIGAGWILVGSWIVLTSLLSRRIRVFVYDEGMVYQRPQLAMMRREQVETLWKDVRVHKTHTTRTYKLRLDSGETFIFYNNLLEIHELGRLLEQELNRRHLPKAIATYKSGSPVSFGIIVVDQKGISVELKRRKQYIAWSEVEHIAIKETSMSIYKRGENEAWSVIPAAWIPNVIVLKGLLYDIRHMHVRFTRDPLSQLIATYKAGLPVSLGHITLSTQGISIDDGKKHFAWSELASIGVGEQEVIIRLKGKALDWYVIPAWMVSDPVLLKGLINHIMQSTRLK